MIPELKRGGGRVAGTVYDDNGHDLEDLDGGGFGLYFTLLLTK